MKNDILRKIWPEWQITKVLGKSGDEGVGHWTYEAACVKIGGKWYLHRPGFDCI